MASLRVYGAMTWLERLHMIFSLLPLPLALISRLLLSPFREYDRDKSWRRVLAHTSFRFSSSSLRVNQIQGLLGTDIDVYEKWIRKHKVERCIEDLDEGASLMWLSERSLEKVILYIHGGCYLLPMQDFAADYWKQTVDSLNKTNQEGPKVSLVALKYSLIPDGYFPTPLKQIVLAVQYLLSQGTNPENIHVAGESAGGALVLQLLSHLLHPFPETSLSASPSSNVTPQGFESTSVPKLELPHGSKLGSMCIMSPISSLRSKSTSYTANSDRDVLPTSSWSELCAYSVPLVENSPSAGPYLEPATAPKGWFDGAGRVVKRVFVSVGEYECLRDDVLEVMKKFEGHGEDDKFLTTFIEKKGVHNSQYLDCMAGEAGESSVTISGWMKESLGL